MSQCFAFDCNHRAMHEKCQFFRFPKDAKTFKRWRDMSWRSDTEPKAFHRLCSCHFLNGEKKNGPTIFKRNEAKCFRFQSPEKRRRTKKTCVAQSSDIVTPSNDMLESTIPNPQPAIEEVLPCSVELPSYEYLLKSLGEANQVIARLELALEASRSEVALLKASSLTPGNVLTYDSLTTDFKLLHYFTGLPSFGSFQLLLQLLSSAPLSYYDGWKAKMPLKDQLLLTLMKLRLNSDYTDLSTRFQISRHSVRNIFLTILYALHNILFQVVVSMPSVRKNQAILPPSFKNFPNCRSIVDCTEVQCADPCQNLENQSKTYSHYKHRNTFKALVACSPHGAVTYVSRLYPGSYSDKAIFKHCGIAELFVEGDLILADKGFLISDLLPPGVSVNIPPFLTNQQFTEREIKITAEIARARIEIERVKGRLKSYKILDFIPVWCREHSSVIIQVVACLINLHHPLNSPLDSQNTE